MATTKAVTATPERPRTNRIRGVCRYFSKPGGCYAGDQCKFLHIAPDNETDAERALSPYDANKVCRYFAQGFCRRGTACWFKHELRAPEPPVASTIDEDDLLCTICFERPEEYGLLDRCNHVFCKTCIRGWREANGKSVDVLISQMNKTCPSCRTRSRFIIPCSRFPENAQRKEEIVASYKASMARVDCKYFVVSRDKPFCPYGRDCFYKHEREDGTPYVFDEGVDALMERFKRRLQDRAELRPSQSDFISVLRSFADSLLDVTAGAIGDPPLHRLATGTRTQRDGGDGLASLAYIEAEEYAIDDDGDDDGEVSEVDDEDNYSLAVALQHSILMFHDTLRQTLAAPGNRGPPRPAPASAEQQPQEPSTNRQYDVFDLD